MHLARTMPAGADQGQPMLCTALQRPSRLSSASHNPFGQTAGGSGGSRRLRRCTPCTAPIAHVQRPHKCAQRAVMC
eukprot:1373900-Lingulodinium_polyedra.AAC.1